MTTRSNRAIAFVGSFLLALCGAHPSAAQPATKSFDFRWHVGLAHSFQPDSIWVAIQDTTLAPGDSVTFLWNPEGAKEGDLPILERGVVMERIMRPRDRRTFDNMWDQGGPLTKGAFYRAASRDTIWLRGLGFAFRRPLKGFSRVRGHVEADLDRDGANERFAMCTSYEDIHLTIWTGEPYKGVERWMLSYYVPYDLDPTCPGTPEDQDE